MGVPIHNHCCYCEPEDCRPGIPQGKCRTCDVLEDMAYERLWREERARLCAALDRHDDTS